jgi:hypothetical protein
MADRNLRDEISNLEERVEALAESLERCRKIMLASKISMIVGGILMLTILLGLFGFDPVAMIVAATAIIGGIVLFGSTRTTANQISAAMRGAELCRTKLISKLELRTVEDKPILSVSVITPGDEGLILMPMRWQLIPRWWKKLLKELAATFNARATPLPD